MTATGTRNQQDRQAGLAADFIDRLSKLEPASRARLKRSAGQALGESGEALTVFYRTLPYGVSERAHDAYFRVATLYPLADGDGTGNLGDTLRRMRIATPSAERGLDRRMAAMLDCDSAELSFRLRQIVRLVHAHRASIDWQRLLLDLLAWDAPARRVQRTWAMSYYAGGWSDGEPDTASDVTVDSDDPEAGVDPA